MPTLGPLGFYVLERRSARDCVHVMAGKYFGTRVPTHTWRNAADRGWPRLLVSFQSLAPYHGRDWNLQKATSVCCSQTPAMNTACHYDELWVMRVLGPQERRSVCSPVAVIMAPGFVSTDSPEENQNKIEVLYKPYFPVRHEGTLTCQGWCKVGCAFPKAMLKGEGFSIPKIFIQPSSGRYARSAAKGRNAPSSDTVRTTELGP